MFFKNMDASMKKQVLILTIPAFIELFLSAMFNMVDMMMLGNYSDGAVSAVGITSSACNILNNTLAAVNISATTLIAWNIGAGDFKKAQQVASQSVGFSILLGAGVSVFGWFIADPLVRFMGANEQIFQNAVTYFQIIALGMIFQAVSFSVTAILRGAGETRLPMYYNLGANLLNVVGNYILIYGTCGNPAMGVAGAAISTTLSRFVCCIAALIIVVAYKRTKIAVRLKSIFRFQKDLLLPILRLGTPSALEQIVMQGGFMLFTRTVAALPTAMYDAHCIGVNISALTYAPGSAFGVAATTLVGQSLGAKRPEHAQAYANYIRAAGMCTACVTGVLLAAFSRTIAGLYTSNTEVIGYVCMILYFVACAQPGQSTQFVNAGILRGSGDTKFPLYVSVGVIWVFRLTLCHILVTICGLGLLGAWITIICDQYLRSACMYLRYRTGRWKRANLA